MLDIQGFLEEKPIDKMWDSNQNLVCDRTESFH